MSKSTMTALPEFLAEYAPIAERLAGEGPEWLQQLRRDGAERSAAAGLPKITDEAWRNTRLDALVGRSHSPAAPATATAGSTFATIDYGGPCLTFVDGRFDAEQSHLEAPEGLWIGRLNEAVQAHGVRIAELFAAAPDTAGLAFEGLNWALVEDAVVVIAQAGAQVETPVHIRHVASGSESAHHARLLIVAERGARATVVESYSGESEGHYFTNAVTQVEVADNARLDHYRVQDEGAGATHIGTSTSRQGRDSLYRGFNLCLGAKLTRMHVTGTLDGEGADCQLYGLSVPEHEQHVDNHTVLDHAKPHGDSRELYKGVLCDSGRSVFSGRIIVREGAQKTDAKQSNPNLLLSSQALAQTRPQLEIYADDVRCTHGATVGEMDADAIFYLQSRGVPRVDARHLLVQAFAGEVSEQIEVANLRGAVETEVARRLPREIV